MRLLNNWIGCTSLAAMLLAAGWGKGADWKRPGLDREAPIDIEADSFSAEKEGWVTASGNVSIRQGDTQITADRIRVNKETGEIVADGNVILIRLGQGATRTDRLEYNYKTGRGSVPGIDLRVGPLRIITKSGMREPDETFRLEDTIVTTCTNAVGKLHYHMYGRTAIAKPGEYVALAGAKPHFMGIPFFYFPYWRRELDEHYGWRFEPGYESDLGLYLLSTYKFKLIDFGGTDNNAIDSRSHFDYRTERGGAIGQDLVWYWGPKESRHEGFVSAYYIDDDKPMYHKWDRDPMRDTVESSRYRLMLRHDSRITSRDFLTVRTSYLSDSYLLEDFYESEYRDLVQPESYASYTHSGDGYAFGLDVYQRANKFYNSVNRTPEAWLDIMRTDIAGSPVYYESQTAFSYLEREFADYGHPSNVVNEAYNTVRFDTRQALYMPNNLFGFLSFVPRAIWRGTYYGDTRSEKKIYSGTTNEAPQTIVYDDSAKLRSLFELGLETSFKAYGIYETEGGGRVRHIVEPYVNYTFIPEPSLRPYRLYQFDSVDSLDKSHTVRFGTRHQLQRRVEDSIKVLLDADLYGIYDIEDSNGDSQFSWVGFNGRFRPADGLRFQIDGLYDVQESDLDYLNIWATLWNNELWEAAGEMFYRPDRSTLFAGSLTFAPSHHWSFNLYSRYEAETSRLEEQAGYLQYNLDCISFRLRGSFYPSFTRADGTEREAKYKVGLYVWLRAFSEPPKGRLAASHDL